MRRYGRTPADVVVECLKVHILSKQTYSTWSLYRDVARPYLCRVPAYTVVRTLVCELSSRMLLYRLKNTLYLLGETRVCCAGGFAAWELERSLETHLGRDGYPRTFRNSQIVHGSYPPRCRLWIPHDVDIFVSTSSPNLVMEAIRMVYREFASDLFGGCPGTIHEERIRNQTDGFETTTSYVRFVAESLFLPASAIEQLIDHVESTTHLEPIPTPIDAWSLRTTQHDFVFPSTLNVALVDPANHDRVSQPYFPISVVGTFDLSHCGVVLDVDVDTGAWQFECSPTTLADLRHRRLRLNRNILGRECTAMRTVCRIVKYSSRGFSLVGDDDFETDLPSDTRTLRLWNQVT